ncbi:SMC protein [Spraguea lophii 42_110]|uniref:Structural maintenance of chromosomes protein n=1 Tax=Spraguea lophii (strain 42_110) TaxID=1358809 RepID=S7WB03_SPRLO|nr:SMC protein [Spraguea lophii 42_110]
MLMGIKKLKIINFKSYVGEHMIGPFDRLSCIVGPNGCGKSNIMDCISFVLCYPIKLLRSISYSDLISIGEDKTAVKLYIDDYSICREIDKRGVFVYYYNNEKVAEETYKNILKEKNISSELRNLVFQGDIDFVASKTPLELTRLVEELSGSIKYKKQYDELSKKYNDMSIECVKVYETRKEALQSIKDAKCSKENKKKVKALEFEKDEIMLQLRLASLKESEDSIKTLENEIITIKENNKIEEEKYFEEKIKETDKERLTAQKEYIKAKRTLSKHREDENECKIYLLNNEINANEGLEKTKIIHHEMKEIKNKISVYQKTIIEKEKDLESSKRILGLYKNEREQKEKKLNDIVTPYELENMKDKYQSEIVDEQEEINNFNLNLKPLEERCKSTKKKIKELKSKKEEYEKERKIREERVKEEENKIKGIKNTIKELEERIKNDRQNYEVIIQKEKEKNEEFKQIMTKILAEDKIKKENERKTKILETVNVLKTLFKGIKGRFIDLIEPTQKKYEIALSVLMGANDQSVIVENENTAFKAISYLKDKKMCRLTFLPLNILKGKKIDKNSINEYRKKGTVIEAIETIKFKEENRSAIEKVLGNSLIVEDIDLGAEISKKLRNPISTQTGVLFHKSGFITGGGSKNSKFQNKEHEKLLENRNKILTELNNLFEKKKAFGHIEIIVNKISTLEEEIKEIESTEDISKDIHLLNESLDKLQTSLSEDEQKIEKILKRSEKLILNIQKKEQKIFGNLFKKTGIKNLHELDIKNIYEEKNYQAEMMIRKIEREIFNMNQEIENLTERNEKLQLKKNTTTITEVEDTKRKQKTLETLIQQEEKRLINLENNLNSAKSKYEDIKNNYNQIVKEKNNTINIIVQIENNLENKIEEFLEIIKSSIIEEIKIPLKNNKTLTEEIGTKLINSENNKECFENIKIDYTKMKKDIKYNGRLSEIIKEIDTLIPTITEDATPINYSTHIKNYEETRKKVLQQKQKFQEIKTKRIELFLECFNIISNEISTIYKKLTKNEEYEGSAHLVLENKIIPFESGIKFHVMPPKKRFREMRFLSGGEKIMASLSFILSFHKYKPSSFYIFDEIDSALDLNNVQNIANYLRLSNIQFILISLKPLLTQYADSLIGVYKKNNKSNILTYRLNNENYLKDNSDEIKNEDESKINKENEEDKSISECIKDIEISEK